MSGMWTSKLGNKYDQAWIKEQDAQTHAALKRLRSNTSCADCGVKDTAWASVNHGVFICVACSDVHRSVGTHVTKVKGCTGTYLWGPDELQQMQQVGNTNAETIYGSKKVSPDASKTEKQQYVVDKYDKRLFAITLSDGRHGQAAPEGAAPVRSEDLSRQQVRGRDKSKKLPSHCSRRCANAGTSGPIARVAEVSDSLFDELFADWSAPHMSKSQSAVTAKPSETLDDLLASPVLQKSSVAAATEPSQILEDIFHPQAFERNDCLERHYGLSLSRGTTALDILEDDSPPRSPMFSGDFYHDYPDFSRGCSFGLSHTSRAMAGDFYREPDVTRSTRTGVPPGGYTEELKRLNALSSRDESLKDSADVGAFKRIYSGPGSLPCGKMQPPLEPENLSRGEFTPADIPPPAPTDEFWKFQSTKVQVETKGPLQGYTIGNNILAFLRNKVVSSILKKRSPNDPDKNDAKFAITAEVFIQNVMCMMKIRVFQEKARDTLFCVEFQRRSGDGVAFMKAYDQACMYLRECMGQPPEDKTEASDEPMAIADPIAIPTADEIKPLLDMAAMVHMPSLQAESATALAGLAEDRERAPLLCTGYAFQQFKSLLNCKQTVVAYPIARTLSSLAGCGEAARHFVEQGVLEIIVDKVKEHNTSALVQKHLVQALRCVITHCLPILSENAVRDLLVGLSAAVKAGPSYDGYETTKETREWKNAFARDLQETQSKLHQYGGQRAAGAKLVPRMMV